MYTRCVALLGGFSLQILQHYTSTSVEAIRGHSIETTSAEVIWTAQRKEYTSARLIY
jgi:hypothetical protein